MLLCLFILVGCSSNTGVAPDENDADVYVGKVIVEGAELEDEAVALTDAPAALPLFWEPIASGEKEKKNNSAVIDYSHLEEGYVMVQYTGQTEKRLKVLVSGPKTTYSYNIVPGEWEAFPLSDGNGKYKIAVCENVVDSKYSVVLSLSTEVALKDEFGPFIHSNQYVDFAAAPNTIAKAKELTENKTAALEKVGVIYDYVVGQLTYDKEKASTVKSGYLPVLDSVLEIKKGICFDYAALMTGMLRSQGVPCKLVVGYAGSAYHAWISVWSEETGWLDGAIFFDGHAWQRMDPTFASSANKSESIMKYIGDGSNYSTKYLY